MVAWDFLCVRLLRAESVRRASLITSSPELVLARERAAGPFVALQNDGRDNTDEKHHKKKQGEDPGHLGRTRDHAAKLEEHGEATDHHKPRGIVKHV